MEFFRLARIRKWLFEPGGAANIQPRYALLALIAAFTISSASIPVAIAAHADRASTAEKNFAGNSGETLFTGYVNVRTFGATGDGVTDDTAAIRKAVANAPEGSTIFVPPGTYRITQDISYSASRSISWRGAGHGSVLAFDSSGIVLTGRDNSNVNRLSIEALAIQRRGTAGAALAIDGSTAAGISRWALRDLHIVSSGGTGVYIEGAWIGVMDNVAIMRSQTGVRIEMNRASSNASMNALTVTGGEVQGCNDGWQIKAVAGLTMRGHAVEGNVRGITATHTPRGINIDGGYFEHNTAYDVSFEGPTAGYGNSIRDSIFFSPGSGRATPYAILLNIGKNFVIEGNSFVGYTAAAVRVTDTLGTTTGIVRDNYLSSTAVELSNGGKLFGNI